MNGLKIVKWICSKKNRWRILVGMVCIAKRVVLVSSAVAVVAVAVVAIAGSIRSNSWLNRSLPKPMTKLARSDYDDVIRSNRSFIGL